MSYNGDAKAYSKEAYERRQKEIEKVWQESVKKAQKADVESDQAFQGFVSSDIANLARQKSINEIMVDRLEQVQSQMDALQADTDAVADEMQGLIGSFSGANQFEVGSASSGTDAQRKKLERLYRGY